MRAVFLATTILLSSLALAGAGAADPIVHTYTGASFRNPLTLFEPSVICMGDTGYGGACFPSAGAGRAVFRVRPDTPTAGEFQAIFYAYAGNTALTGDVACVRDNSPHTFSYNPAADRLVVGVGFFFPAPFGDLCPSAAGTSGEIEVVFP